MAMIHANDDSAAGPTVTATGPMQVLTELLPELPTMCSRHETFSA
jgi:hypothetical protein